MHLSRRFALSATILALPLVSALSPSEFPVDIPVSQLLQNAKMELAAGNAQDALTYFDIAINRDPTNYLTIFNRGVAYLSLGKSQQARRDFDKVLQLKSDFEGALVQRAKLSARQADWEEAEKDYANAGRSPGSQEVIELREAHGSSMLAQSAADAGNWEECVHQAGAAIIVASRAPDLRKLRAKCRFERGEVAEGVSDLQHVLSMSPGDIEPHLKISTLQFYGMAERKQGIDQLNKCLQSDPDSKRCMKLRRREKALDKSVKSVLELVERKQNMPALKILQKSASEPGLLQEVKDDFEEHKREGLIHRESTNGLYTELLDKTCEIYVERKKDQDKIGKAYCEEVLLLNPTSLPGLVAKSRRQMDGEEFEAAIGTLNEAKEVHGNIDKIQKLIHEAQMLLKRSKQKDYYKVLGVGRDADEREIKKACRRGAQQYHPDKAAAKGISKDEAEKKMASLNEACEVLKDPELRARFDRGDDPNDPHQNQGGHPFHGSPFGQGGQQFVFRHSGPGGGGQQFQFNGFPGGFPF